MALRRVLYTGTLLGTLVFYFAYQQWVSWLLLLLVVLLPWFSLVVSLPGMLTTRLSTVLPPVIPLGQYGEVVLWGRSKFPLPPVKAKLLLHRPLQGELRRCREGEYLAADHCGSLEVSAEKAWVCDYLGLFRFRLRNIEPCCALARPEPMALPAIPELERHLAMSWRPKAGGGFAENHELRLYRPGDPLNQIHWKLTAKTGKLTIREPMEPQRGRMLLSLNLKGTPEELDRMLGRLLWLGNQLLDRGLRYEIRALTGEGVETLVVLEEADLTKAMDHLLRSEPAGDGDIREQPVAASWQYHVGGLPDEA